MAEWRCLLADDDFSGMFTVEELMGKRDSRSQINFDDFEDYDD